MHPNIPKLIKPVSGLKGRINIPGDKSISHRALMLGALANGRTTITNLSPGKDVSSTALCLRQLGIEIEENGACVYVHGKGIRGLQKPESVLNAGNSGTTMRLLSGILAAQDFESTITGDASLTSRPMKRIMQPLKQMGAVIKAQKNQTAPLKIIGKPLNPIHYLSPVASAQVKSCVMLAGLFTNGRTSVTEPALSRDHTERMLQDFGLPVHHEDSTVSIDGPASLSPSAVDVPGDISSAAFFMVAAAIVPHSKIKLCNVGINPTRLGIHEALIHMGLHAAIKNHKEKNREPRADIIVHHQNLRGMTIEGKMVPKIIDEIPILAIAATQAHGVTVVRDAKELRVKESDRIDAITRNLRAMGAEVQDAEDGFTITGPQKLKGAHIDSMGDHRIAMAFSVAGLIAEGDTIIENADCAEISYPGFFETLESLRRD